MDVFSCDIWEYEPGARRVTFMATWCTAEENPYGDSVGDTAELDDWESMRTVVEDRQTAPQGRPRLAAHGPRLLRQVGLPDHDRHAARLRRPRHRCARPRGDAQAAAFHAGRAHTPRAARRARGDRHQQRWGTPAAGGAESPAPGAARDRGRSHLHPRVRRGPRRDGTRGGRGPARVALHHQRVHGRQRHADAAGGLRTGGSERRPSRPHRPTPEPTSFRPCCPRARRGGRADLGPRPRRSHALRDDRPWRTLEPERAANLQRSASGPHAPHRDTRGATLHRRGHRAGARHRRAGGARLPERAPVPVTAGKGRQRRTDRPVQPPPVSGTSVR